MRRWTMVAAMVVALALSGRAQAAALSQDDAPLPPATGREVVASDLPFVGDVLGRDLATLGRQVYSMNSQAGDPAVKEWGGWPKGRFPWWIQRQSGTGLFGPRFLDTDRLGRVTRVTLWAGKKYADDMSELEKIGVKKPKPKLTVDHVSADGVVARYVVQIVQTGDDRYKLIAVVELRPRDWWVADNVDDATTAQAIREGRLLVGMTVPESEQAMDGKPARGKQGPDGQEFTWRQVTKGEDGKPGKPIQVKVLVKDGKIVEVVDPREESKDEAGASKPAF